MLHITLGLCCFFCSVECGVNRSDWVWPICFLKWIDYIMNLSDYLNKLKQTEPTVAVPQAVSNMKNEYYDYGGYRDKYGEFDMSGGKHLTDEFKLPAHMTFSDDSIYSGPGREGGKWRKGKDNKWEFTPSSYNLQQTPIQDLQEYFNTRETNSRLILPQALKGL